MTTNELYKHTEIVHTENGRSIYCLPPRVHHKGQPNILLLHGNPSSIEDWSVMLKSLQEIANVAALDFPGFGKSPIPEDSSKNSMNLDAFAADVMAVADHLNWQEPFYVAGHSHGGGVAQTAAANYPERIKGVIAMGTLGWPAHGSYKLLPFPGVFSLTKLVLGLLKIKGFHFLIKAIINRSLKSICFPDKVDQDMVNHAFTMLLSRPEILLSSIKVTLGNPSNQLYENARRIKCPMLFIHGEKDQLVPFKHALHIHERLISFGSNSTFHLAPNSGHLLIQFQSEEVVSLIKEFIHCNE